MANEQNKFSQNPSSTGGSSSAKNSGESQSSASTANAKGTGAGQNSTSTAAARKESPVSSTAGVSDQPASALSAAGSTDTGKSLLDQAKDTAGQAYEAASGKAVSKIDDQKLTLASGLSSVAESVRQVGQNLKGPNAQDGIAKYTVEYSDTAAHKIEQVANYFERKDVKEMFRDVEDFARKNPAAFIGGAFVLGIIAARFLKSSSPKHLTKAAGQSFSSERRPFNEGFGRGETQPSAGALH